LLGEVIINVLGDCAVSGVSGPTRRTAVRRDGHCE